MQVAFAAGWPGESAHPESAAARVYSAIRSLRDVGLRPWLLSCDDGYMLATELDVQTASDGSATFQKIWVEKNEQDE